MSRILFLFAAVGCLLMLTAGAPSIGVVQSGGEFRVDGASVRGNATLFDGSLVETASARSILQLGALQVTLLPESRVKVFHDHLEAGSLHIASPVTQSALQVQTAGARHVAVASRTGNIEVRNAAGMLVANVHAGDSLNFDDQAAASTALRMSGVVQTRGGSFFLTDATTNVTVELKGSDLAKYAGKKVLVEGSSIPGAPAAAGASQVVQVISIQSLAAGAGGAAAATGLSLAARAAIIGGVSVGGAAAGLAAAGTFSSSAPLSNK